MQLSRPVRHLVYSFVPMNPDLAHSSFQLWEPNVIHNVCTNSFLENNLRLKKNRLTFFPRILKIGLKVEAIHNCYTYTWPSWLSTPLNQEWKFLPPTKIPKRNILTFSVASNQFLFLTLTYWCLSIAVNHVENTDSVHYFSSFWSNILKTRGNS
jgi:hypothetical protein